MHPTLAFLFYLAALACFVVAAFRSGRENVGGRDLNLVALGLAFWVAVPLWSAADAAF